MDLGLGGGIDAFAGGALRDGNVPKPTRATLSPSFIALAMVERVTSKAFLASALLRPAPSAIAEMSSVLFIDYEVLEFISKEFGFS